MSSDRIISQIKFEKMFTANKYFLIGAKLNLALKALEFGREYHTGLRKDGSPEYSHQLSQMLYLQSLIGLMKHPQETLAAVALHDVKEDYGIQSNRVPPGMMPVTYELIEKEFGSMVAESVDLMDKNRLGSKMSDDQYYDPIALNPIASIVKPADRVHNFYTMVGAFTKEKQISYMEVGRNYVLPLVKAAGKNFPEQLPVYQNLGYVLKMQIELISVGLEIPAGI